MDCLFLCLASYFFVIFSFIPVWLPYLVRVPSCLQHQELLYVNSMGGGGTIKRSSVNCKQVQKTEKKTSSYIHEYMYIYINICTYVYAPKYQVQRVRLGVVTTLFLCLASYFFLPSPSLSRYGDSILFVFLRLCSTRSCYMPTPWGVGCTINILRKLQTTIAKKNKKKSSQNHFNII